VRIPAALKETWRHEPEWLDAIPRLVAECAERWQLELEEPFDTPHSLVVPAGAAVLKLNAPTHFEADHEADALERWAGQGAVRLLERNDDARALLVECCLPGTELRDAGVEEEAVVAELLVRLRAGVDGRHPFRLLADEADRWAEEIPRRYAEAGKPFERSLLDAAAGVYRSVDRSAAHLVNQDLHGGNILRAEREPWLVIDPKPLVGEIELDGAGLLRNASDVGRLLDVLRDLGLDRERAREWGFAHAVAWSWDERSGWSSGNVERARMILSAP
jgi:streptomycin 6-kinase